MDILYDDNSVFIIFPLFSFNIISKRLVKLLTWFVTMTVMKDFRHRVVGGGAQYQLITCSFFADIKRNKQ